MIIYLASGNLHKKQEMQDILSPAQIIIPSEQGIEFDPDETSDTFSGNSLIKAESLWKIVKKPVIADDSGICVDLLDGRPGIYSARYTGLASYSNDGKKLTDTDRNFRLLEEVHSVLKQKNLPADTPVSCHYVCSMVLYLEKDRFFTVQETFEGFLVNSIEEARGKNGFGYDPIVYLPEFKKTVAELTPEEKNSISHRGKAVRQLKKIMDTMLF